MQFQLSSLPILALVASVHITPAVAASPGLYLCQNWGFNEQPNFCNHYTEPWGKCSKCPGSVLRRSIGPDYVLNGNIATITDRFPPDARGVSSAGPDPGNWCTLYE